jgi:hypothetical protein
MKALTLTQPWASLVAIGAKQIETRSWSTNFRGPLAIHAAKGFPRGAQDFTYEKAVRDCLLAGPLEIKVYRSRYSGGGIYRLDTQLPRGAVVATCNLLDCVPTEARGCLAGVFSDYPELDTPQEQAFGDFSAGRWCWVLEDIKMFPKAIPAKGALGLWEWSGA